MDVDEVWTHVGEFGPSQKLIFYCLCLAQVFASIQVFIFLLYWGGPWLEM